MTSFYLAAATLAVVALALLLRPWWPTRRRVASADFSPALNAAIHRDRLGELERDRSNGTLTDADLAEAKEELQRQLLDDTRATEVVEAGGSGRLGAAVIAVIVPLVAVGLYALLGSPMAVLPGAAQVQKATADMEQLTIKLAKKLEQNPDNPEGWAMLARSYKSVGRWDDAERAFGRIGPELERNAELLAELAEMLVQKSNGFSERPRQLIRQALSIDPNNMLALFLGGGDAFESARYAEAAALWEKLLPQLEPGGEDARMVEASIARARERSGGKLPPASKPDVGPGAVVPGAVVPGAVMPQDDVHKGVGKKDPGTTKEAGKDAAKASALSVSGRVELSPALKDKAKPDDVVFIFARAVDGPRMPLAAQRARVADLPIDFVLDDSKSVMPQAIISTAGPLRVEVRISKSGQAMAGKGDLTGKSAVVKPGASGLKVVIDQLDP